MRIRIPIVGVPPVMTYLVVVRCEAHERFVDLVSMHLVAVWAVGCIADGDLGGFSANLDWVGYSLTPGQGSPSGHVGRRGQSASDRLPKARTINGIVIGFMMRVVGCCIVLIE